MRFKLIIENGQLAKMREMKIIPGTRAEFALKDWP